jgi:hypothetical protein
LINNRDNVAAVEEALNHDAKSLPRLRKIESKRGARIQNHTIPRYVKKTILLKIKNMEYECREKVASF